MAPFSLPLVVIWGGAGWGGAGLLWLVEDNPLVQGWGGGQNFFGLPDSPHDYRLGIGPALCCVLPESSYGPLPSPFSASHPSLMGSGRSCVWHGMSWGVVGRDGAGLVAAGSVVSGKAGIFSSTARLPSLFSLPLMGGPFQGPWEHITRLSAPRHLLKISPISLWFIFCSDVCLPT